jgi:MFS family permease
VVAAFASPLLCALGAVAPSFAWLTATQALGRPIAIAMGLLIGIIVVEEMPRDCRAYAISLLALAVGLGAGVAVVSLPLADLGTRGWRLIYVVGLVFLVVAADLARRLPESRRFATPHAEAPRLPRRRFALLAAAGFLLNLLTAPASFFQNRYLKDVRGYSATAIAVFTVVTNTPAGVGVVAGGRLADVHGRRIVGAVATVGGAVFTVLAFYASGPPLWLANMIGSIVAAASIPALGVYTAELFPTGRRGMANGFIAASSLAGSSVGLLVAGWLVDEGFGYGPTMTLLAIGPLLVAVLVIVWFPETAHLELEQINPGDRRPSDAQAAAVLASSPEGAEEAGDG